MNHLTILGAGLALSSVILFSVLLSKSLNESRIESHKMYLYMVFSTVVFMICLFQAIQGYIL